MFNKFLHVVTVLAMLTATLAVAQEQVGNAVGAGSSVQTNGAEGGAGASGGRAHPSNASASKWGPTRNGSASTQIAHSVTATRTPGRVQEQPVSQPSVSKLEVSKQQVHPTGGRVGASAKVAPSTAASSGSARPAFVSSGGHHVSSSHGSGRRKPASTSLLAQQIKGSPTASHRMGGKHGHGKSKAPKDAEPITPKGEQDCDHASKLQLCTWL
jgi:hypothetical protein